MVLVAATEGLDEEGTAYRVGEDCRDNRDVGRY
jgi:hypothetical protein